MAMPQQYAPTTTAILVVGLVPLRFFTFLRVGQIDLYALFQHVVDRLPVRNRSIPSPHAVMASAFSQSRQRFQLRCRQFTKRRRSAVRFSAPEVLS